MGVPQITKPESIYNLETGKLPKRDLIQSDRLLSGTPPRGYGVHRVLIVLSWAEQASEVGLPSPPRYRWWGWSFKSQGNVCRVPRLTGMELDSSFAVHSYSVPVFSLLCSRGSTDTQWIAAWWLGRSRRSSPHVAVQCLITTTHEWIDSV